MTRLTPRTNELIQGFAAASLSTNTSPNKTPTSAPNTNNIPQANDSTASPNVEATDHNLPASRTTSAPVKPNATEHPQTEEEGNASIHSICQSAPSPPNFIRTTSSRPPISRLPPIPPHDALILKISHLLLIDYTTAANFHRAIISSSDAALTPGSSEYFEYVGASKSPPLILVLEIEYNINVCV